MPVAQYQRVLKKQYITRNILTPKRITELRYWIKECQRVIPEIFKMIAESEVSAVGPDGWFVANTDVDVKWIKFNLESRLGEKAHLVINREMKL